MKMDAFFARTLSVAAMALGTLVLSGCSAQKFYASYYIDPKPAHVDYSDLVPPVERQPVYLVFDMYSTDGSFPEATRKIAPKVSHADLNASHVLRTDFRDGRKHA